MASFPPPAKPGCVTAAAGYCLVLEKVVQANASKSAKDFARCRKILFEADAKAVI
jgi:hypothetical protein